MQAMNRRRVVAGLGAIGAVAVTGRVVSAEDAAAANKAVVQRYFDEVMTAGDLTNFDAMVAEDYQPTDPADAPGRDALRQRTMDGLTTTRNDFSEFRFDVEELTAEGERVAVRARFVGTTVDGADIDVLALYFIGVRDGRLTTAWQLVDETAFREQMMAT